MSRHARRKNAAVHERTMRALSRLRTAGKIEPIEGESAADYIGRLKAGAIKLHRDGVLTDRQVHDLAAFHRGELAAANAREQATADAFRVGG